MKSLSAIILILVTLFSTSPIKAQEEVPPELSGVGIQDKLGAKLNLESQFVDESGKNVKLAEFFNKGKPVVILLMYYECPNLCGLLLNGFLDSLKNFEWLPGAKFDVLSISIDPKESYQLAAQKKQSVQSEYAKADLTNAWHFLTGTEANISEVAKELGFGYKYDEDQQQFAHAAGIFVLTPEAKLSRTLYGIQFEPRDLKLAMLEASQGKIGTVVDKLLLFCYHYDPKGKKYAIMATNVMKLAGLGTVFLLLLYFLKTYFGSRSQG